MESIVKIDRIDEGIIVIKMALGKRLLNIFSMYAPQAGRSNEEKDWFLERLLRVLVGIPDEESVIVDEESVIVAGDLNGHAGEKSEGYEGIHGGFGYGQRNC